MNTQTRFLQIDTRYLDTATRTVPAVLSSEYPVTRQAHGILYREILSHAPGAVDLSRQPLPLIESHDNTRLNIGIVENVRLDGAKLRGIVRLGATTRASELWRDIEAGIVRNLSIGYRIHAYTESGDTLTATRWEPFEVSLVAAAADPNAGLNRSLKSITQGELTVENTELTSEASETRAIELERTRVAEIDDLFSLSVCQSLPKEMRTRAIKEGWSIDKTRQAAMTALEALSSPVVDHRYTTDAMLGIHHDAHIKTGNRFQYGEHRSVESNDDFMTACVDALVQRSGLTVKNPHPAAADLFRMSVSDMMRTLASRQDRTAGSWLKSAFWRGSGHTTSDFTSLLGNVASKSAMLSMAEYEHSWRPLVRTIDVDDFKDVSLIGMGAFSDLQQIPEGGEYQQGSLVDWSETVKVLTYGRNFGLPREALINDNLDEFANLSRQFAASASRKIAALVFGLINSNPTLAYDSTAVFHADHSNLAGSGAAVSITTLDAGITAMRTQTSHVRATDGSDPIYLNIRPKYLVTPVSKEMAAKTVVASSWYPVPNVGDVPSPFAASPLQGSLEVISDPLLSGVAWYLLADPAMHDCIVLASLSGSGAFGLLVETFPPTHDSDATWVKVRIDVGAAMIDYRSAYKNPGA